MHDGIELEKRHIPTAVIVTDLFINTAKVIAAAAGIPDYPFAVIPHPIGRINEAEIADRAKAVMAKVEELLVSR